MIPGVVIIPLLIGDNTVNPQDAILTENDIPIMDEWNDPLLVDEYQP
jgi:hypothetical protein